MLNYNPPTSWTGRIDGSTPTFLRWHQVVQPIHLFETALPALAEGQQGVALLGFACDEGVRRNKGRTGAAKGPQALRAACANFPVHFANALQIIDAGDIVCEDSELETAQAALANAVAKILSQGYRPVLLGGGHEIAYAHVTGIQQHLTTQKKLGIINFDAHFDLRMPDAAGPSSGTGFWQLSQESRQRLQPFYYLALGIQTMGNTAGLFQSADERGVRYVNADAFHFQETEPTLAAIREFIDSVDHIYFTTCLDVFSAAFAPGVSATAFNGILPTGLTLQCYRTILESGKVISSDIAELNPDLDIDNRTAKLAAALVFETISALTKEK